MGILYDITEDYLYQEGQKDKARGIIIKMLHDNTLSVEKIAAIVDVSVEYVKQIAQEIKQ